MKKVILITGASSGLGRAMADYLFQQGYVVFGTSRYPDDREAGGWKMLVMDVKSTSSVNNAVNRIIIETGRIDAVVNNAGFGISGPIEKVGIGDAKAQFETNVFGVMRVCQAVIPTMRKQGSGRIINISSMGGLIGLPYQGLYSASKFAIEGLSEALYKELYSFGIRVVLIEPGDFRTEFTSNRKVVDYRRLDSEYSNEFKRVMEVIKTDETEGDDPLKIGKLAARILESNRPRFRYKAGFFIQKLAPVIKNIIPERAFARLIMNHYQVGKLHG